ncbi:retrovirus-related Pol poly from transposon [Paramuricea clavata]|uniref:Retrovirus-related Pol poly from transposon n=1 Tax=Paramuricea clavata TaxID=317549 RepID=A0A6S7LNJ8_PARCT|nr:retrovirus-related Pol poly from transposon [Paramuricea clavata]
MLHGSKLHYPAVEKEAMAIVEAVRKWQHFLARRHFTLKTDQRSVAFMFDSRKRTKIKNNKIQAWRLELGSFSYTVEYRPGKDNVAPDSFTRAFSASMSSNNLEEIHIGLCHPGVTRMLHFVKSKNLPYSTEEVKKVCSACRSCAELKPQFYRPQQPGNLIKATQPMERLSIDFKGPLPTATRNAYILTVVDEYSRFPFAFPCPNMQSSTVIMCLNQLFSLCGMPNYIHSDLGTSFLSRELKDYLTKRGIATSRTTPYHPIGNGQVERYNGIIWKAVLALRSANLPDSRWELVLADALHSIRSLLCTSTNATPHERFFNFHRRSSYGVSLPSWMQPGPVLLRRFVRTSKNDPLVNYGRRLLSLPNIVNNNDEKDPDWQPNKSEIVRKGVHLEKLIEHFWKRWRNEYLLELRESHRLRIKNTPQRRIVRVGDVVVVRDDTPRVSWKIGRVEELITGKDDQVRGAAVKISSKGMKPGKLRRPIQALIPLEINDAENEDAGRENPSKKKDDPEETVETLKPRRKAGVIIIIF